MKRKTKEKKNNKLKENKVTILKVIQAKLKAPKNQFNAFGKYNYRSCEDILEAVKPLLGEATLTISDEVVSVGNRYYVKATATLKDKDITISVTAYAREAEAKKGMDEAQITGAASSYARKYALNGLFLIDDTKDADSQPNGNGKQEPNLTPEPEITAEMKCDASNIMTLLDACETVEDLKANAENYKEAVKKLHTVLQEDVKATYKQVKERLTQKGKVKK